ncbi:dNA polymerase III subunit beta [Coraliomargarita sp. CAG:312]|jgi:DNA polymerase III, beta subunit|nr:dNA polymerase III subunit beta [Coraliomargarita sp. CAG:312]
MKFKINKEHFATGLRQVTNVVSSKPSMPVLNNVLIKAEGDTVVLTTTNLDLGIRCSIKAEVEKPGEITLPVKKLAAIVNSMPQQEITLESGDGQVARIRSGRSDFQRFNGLKAEDFPPLPSFVDQHNYELGPQELLNMLRSVSYAQSSDENRYILNSVFFNFSEGKLTLVATDGRRLALISRDMKIDREDEGSIILPAKTVSELEKLLTQGKNVKISFNDRQVAFDIEVGEESSGNGLTGSIYLVSKIVEGSYPNYKQVIPKETEHRIKVERELMLETVRRVALMTTDKQNSVRLKIFDNCLEISGQSSDFGEAKEPIEVEYDGPEVQIGFNPEFLLSPLSNLTKDEIFFEFKDEMSPGVFKTLDNFLCVVMPLRI